MLMNKDIIGREREQQELTAWMDSPLCAEEPLPRRALLDPLSQQRLAECLEWLCLRDALPDAGVVQSEVVLDDLFG